MKKIYLIIALLVALVVSATTFAMTATSATVTTSVSAGGFANVTTSLPTGWTAPSGYGSAPTWSPIAGTTGSVTKGSLYYIDPQQYTGDLLVTLYLNNPADLTKAYSYLNMAIMAQSSANGTSWSAVTSFQTNGNYNYYLTLTNGYVSFVLPGGSKYLISIDNGAYYCVSTSNGSLSPSFYIDVRQA
jgi:hypothetical protein